MPNARKIPGLRSEGQAEKPKHHSRDSEGRSCKLERQRDSFSRGADQSDVPTPDTAASATGASEASRDCWQASEYDEIGSLGLCADFRNVL